MRGNVKVLAALTGMVVLASVVNAGVPRMLDFQGRLTDVSTGSSLSGPVSMTFRLYNLTYCDTGTSLDALWSETHTGVELDNGIFSVTLGSQISFPDSLKFDEEYCLGIEVEGEEMLPRQHFSSVAYALNSLRADTALTVLEFPSHDHDDLYYTETELNSPGTVNNPTNPVDWTMLKNVPADFADGIDNTAAGGISEVIAGEGLTEEMAGDVKILSVTPGGIQETMLADSAVTGDKIRSNSITSAQIAPGAVTAGEIASGTITSAQIASSTITAAEISGNTITSAQIASSTITAAEISGNTITAAQIAPAAITANEIFSNTLTADQLATASVRNDELADSSVTGNKIQPGAVTALQIYDGSILFDDIGQNGATTGQVMMWNGSAWVADDDNEGGVGDITSVTAGAGLTGGGDTLDVTLDVDFAGTGVADSVARSDHDHDAVYLNEGQANSVDSSMILDGSIISADIMDGTISTDDIGQNGASDGQVLKWDDATMTWIVANDSVGTGGSGSGGWVDDGTMLRLEAASDSVGIGTSSPTEKLDVDGNFRVSGSAAIGPGHDYPGSYVFVAGYYNDAMGDTSTIAGGSRNHTSGHLSTIGGGSENYTGHIYATIAGGRNNRAMNEYSTVCGGRFNVAEGMYSVVCGGGNDINNESNQAFGDFSAIGGGRDNETGYNGGGPEYYGEYATVSGGMQNTAYSNGTTVGGGLENFAGEQSGTPDEGDYATVGGGRYNTARGRYSTVGGGGGASPGLGNEASGYYCFVGGGSFNKSGMYNNPSWEDYAYAVIGGGYNNHAQERAAVVGGGEMNSAVRYCVVGGGEQNQATQDHATIGGGYDNEAGNNCVVSGGSQNAALNGGSTVGGGMNNQADHGGTVGGGTSNIAAGQLSTIPGGRENEATGDGSFAAGTQARARHEGSFVLSANWPSSGDDTISTGGIDQFVIRADGGIYITNTSGQAPYDATRLINTSSGAWLSSAGQWRDSSDRNLKENFEPVDGEKLLEKIAELPVTRWNYKVEGEDVKHIGPVAQDFYEILGIGNDDRSIAAMDEAGISLAAIQQLYMKSQRQGSEIEDLKEEIGELKKLVRALLDKE